MPTATVTNNGPGLRSFKNAFNQDITIQPGDSRSFDMHPHHLRLLDRESRKQDSSIKLVCPKEVLELVNQPGGNTTEDERRATELHRLQEQQRLARLRKEGEDLQQSMGDQRYITDPKTVPDDKGKQPEQKAPQTKTPEPKKKAAESTAGDEDEEAEDREDDLEARTGTGKQSAKKGSKPERVKLTK